MAITQQRIEQLLNAAEQINQSFEYNSKQTLHLIARARQQIRNADITTSHAVLVTLLSDLGQLHMDYQQQVAQPQIAIAVEREHYRLTHKRNEYKRQWLADKRANIPTRQRAQHIADYTAQKRQQQALDQSLAHDLARDTDIDNETDYFESSDGFAIPETE